MSGLRLWLWVSMLLPLMAAAQDSAHWGVQGSYFRGALPRFIVEQIHDLPEQPDITSKAWNAGIVRFHANGSPNWAVEFTKMQMSISGGFTTGTGGVTPGTVTTQVQGSGLMRGVLFAKYHNFFSTKWISAGIGTGIGITKTEAQYTRYTPLPTGSAITGGDTFNMWLPTFQTVAQADVRPVRWISLSPFYGLRNGTLGFGGAIRIHFTH